MNSNLFLYSKFYWISGDFFHLCKPDQKVFSFFFVNHFKAMGLGLVNGSDLNLLVQCPLVKIKISGQIWVSTIDFTPLLFLLAISFSFTLEFISC